MSEKNKPEALPEPPLSPEHEAHLRERLAEKVMDYHVQEKLMEEIITRCELAFANEFAKASGSYHQMQMAQESRLEMIEAITRLLITEESKQKTIKFPSGATVRLTASKGAIEPEDGDEDACIRLIYAQADDILDPEKYPNPCGEFITLKRSLNKEALRHLPDAVLGHFNLRRESGQSFKLSIPKKRPEVPDKRKSAAAKAKTERKAS